MPEEKATGKYPTKVYSYRIRITEGEDDLRDMLRRARRYYNELITIELERRQRFRELRAKYGVGDIEALEKREAELVEAKNKDEDAVKKEVSHANYLIHKRVKSGEYTAKDAADARKALKVHAKKLYAWIPKDELKAVRAELKEARRLSNEKLKPGNEEFRRRLQALGANNFEKAKAKLDVLQEMADEGTWGEFWVLIKKSDLDAEERSKRARMLGRRLTDTEDGELWLEAIELGPGTDGTYEAVKDSVEQAKAPPKKKGQRRRDPKRKGFDGGGIVGSPRLRERKDGVTTGGIRVSDLFLCNKSQVGIKVHDDGSGLTARYSSRGFRKASGYMKLESGEDGDKLVRFWATLHRPLPEDGRIVRARIKSERSGNTVRHYLQLSVQSELFTRGVKGVGKVAVNFGWRTGKEGLRVATALDELGNVRVFHLPASIKRRLDYAESIRGISDKHFVAVRNYLIGYRREHDCPGWFLEETKGMSEEWESHRRLAKLVNRWQGEALGGRVKLMWSKWKEDWLSDDLFQDLDTADAWTQREFPSLTRTQRLVWWLLTWQRKNAHLFSIERGVHRRALLNRKDYYRRIAAQLSEEYETLVIDDTDLSEQAKRPARGEPQPSEQEKKANANRFIASVSELRQALRERFGFDIIEVPADGVSRDHYGCGGIFPSDARAAEVFVQCSECDQIVDQDVNAARNILGVCSGTARVRKSAKNCGDIGCEPNENAAE